MIEIEPERICIVGLGYVGLPVAVALARTFSDVVGFDVSESRISQLQSGFDRTGEIPEDVLKAVDLRLISDPADIGAASFYIVTVPTPIDAERRPDLSHLESACRAIAPQLQSGDVVVFESTVYPGVTEDVCGKILADASGLTCGVDFHLGYSPERINPGDDVHRLEKITKVIAGQDEPTLARIENVYGAIIEAGLFKASSIRVAEAAKVIENTQRDINIALMNELAIICDLLEIRTSDVLEAARTKWNFLPFTPGLVGGHCIGVDPYYLTSKAEALGYHPQVILSGRHINDGMGAMIARKTVKLLVRSGANVRSSRVGIFGLTFKEDVPDMRNSKVADIVAELTSFGIDPLVHDPIADTEEAADEYDIALRDSVEFDQLDAAILAVPHADYLRDLKAIENHVRDGGVLIDIKSVFDPRGLRDDIIYWSL